MLKHGQRMKLLDRLYLAKMCLLVALFLIAGAIMTVIDPVPMVALIVGTAVFGIGFDALCDAFQSLIEALPEEERPQSK